MASEKISVEKIAQLAYLKLTESERVQFTQQFGDILRYIEQLEGVPMTPEEAKQMGAFHITSAFYEILQLNPDLSIRNESEFENFNELVLRNEEALKNAPRSSGLPGELLFEVPSIIESQN